MHSLEDTLNYDHAGLCNKMATSYDIPMSEAHDLFLETKRWLWLLGRAKQDFRTRRLKISLPITSSLKMIDETWHAFILFTADYTRFCDEYLGGYIHHQPVSKDHMATRDELELTLHYVRETLGRDILIKWYSAYQEKYSSISISPQITRQTDGAPYS